MHCNFTLFIFALSYLLGMVLFISINYSFKLSIISCYNYFEVLIELFISPMLLEKVFEPFDSDQYITELKLDGFRLILSYFNGEYHLYTRHHHEVTSQFTEIFGDSNLPDGTILDGELIVLDKDGKPDFEAVMERFHSNKSNQSAQFCVFDLLYYKGKNVMNLPLLERKKLLSEISFDNKRIVPVQWVDGSMTIQYFQQVKYMDLEGIVMKKKDGLYYPNKRTDQFIKVINYKYEKCLIKGMIKKDRSFILHSLTDNRPIGVMKFVPRDERKVVYRWIENGKYQENDEVIGFSEGIPCEVKYRNWTSKGKLRIPSFYRWLKIDKSKYHPL